MTDEPAPTAAAPAPEPGRHPDPLRDPAPAGTAPHEAPAAPGGAFQHDPSAAPDAGAVATAAQRAAGDATYPATLARPVRGRGGHGVSVVVAARRVGAGLEAALESVWTQRGVPVEVVLVDNATADPDRLRAERLIANGPGRLVRLDTPQPTGEAWRTGFAAASHPILSTLDDETILAPGKLAADAAIVAADAGCVAMADIERRHAGETALWRCASLETLSAAQRIAAIAARRQPLPRHVTFAASLYARTAGLAPGLWSQHPWSLALALSTYAGRFVRNADAALVHTPRRRPASAAATMAASVLEIHLGFLHHADLLATRFGADAVALLAEAAGSIALAPATRDGLARMAERAAFPGHALTDLRALHAALLAGGRTGDPAARLAAAYGALALEAAS